MKYSENNQKKYKTEKIKICQKLGWRGERTEFDLLPLVLQANGEPPELFELPKELAMEVHMSHPKFVPIFSF